MHSQQISCQMWYYYRPQTKFAKVMFSQMSVCPQWGGDYQPPSIHPPSGQTPACADTPLWADTPCPVHAGIHTPLCPVHIGIHTLPAQCMPGYTPPMHAGILPPCPVHARIQLTSGRYASHCNAFLLTLIFSWCRNIANLSRTNSAISSQIQS